MIVDLSKEEIAALRFTASLCEPDGTLSDEANEKIYGKFSGNSHVIGYLYQRGLIEGRSFMGSLTWIKRLTQQGKDVAKALNLLVEPFQGGEMGDDNEPRVG